MATKRPPEPRPDPAAVARVAKARAAYAAVFPAIERLRAEGHSYRHIAVRLNARGLRTRTGHFWHAAQVRKVLLRGRAPQQ
jgi:hypothetical protein